MDGEKRTRIVEKDLGWPNALSTNSQRLYWTDAKLKRIESCNYEGNHRKIILQNLDHPYGNFIRRNLAMILIFMAIITKKLFFGLNRFGCNTRRHLLHGLEVHVTAFNQQSQFIFANRTR